MKTTSLIRLRNIFLTLLFVAACSYSVLAESKAPLEPSYFNGDWKVVLENSNGRKLARFRIEEKDGRLRGKMATRETGTQDLDGRIEDGKILFWSTFQTREGATIDTSFKGVMEGDVIVGDARYFEKPYKFRAERVIKKKP